MSENENPKEWDDSYPGQPSLVKIEEFFNPNKNYRVSPYAYSAGTKFGGVMMDGMVFVLSGGCRYKFADSIAVRAGQYVKLPGGKFWFEAIEDVELVLVWKLP